MSILFFDLVLEYSHGSFADQERCKAQRIRKPMTSQVFVVFN